MKCLAHPTEVQLGMDFDSSYRVVPWELLSLLLVPCQRGKVKNEVFCMLTEVQLGMDCDSSYALVAWELLS